MSHFGSNCPTFFAFCFWAIGNKLLKINSLDDIFERRAADGRDIGSSRRVAGPKAATRGPMPGFGGSCAGWPGLIGRSRVAVPVGHGAPLATAVVAAARAQHAAPLPGMSPPAGCQPLGIEDGDDGHRDERGMSPPAGCQPLGAAGRRVTLELSNRPPDGDGSGDSNRPALWADRRIRSRNRPLALNSIIFLPRCSGTHTTKPEGIYPASWARPASLRGRTFFSITG